MGIGASIWWRDTLPHQPVHGTRGQTSTLAQRGRKGCFQDDDDDDDDDELLHEFSLNIGIYFSQG